MGKQINPYLESFIAAFSATLGLGIGVYIINLILPSYELSIIVILGTVFVGTFSISLGYLKRFSNTQLSELTDTTSKKYIMPIIVHMCIFSILPFLLLYVLTKKVLGLKIVVVLCFVMVVYICYIWHLMTKYWSKK